MERGRSILLINYLGRYYALSTTCTHADGPLDRGRLAGGQIVCPWHGGRFNVKDGQPVSGPPMEPLKQYEVVVRDGHILVDPGPA
ncbi:MAG: Rieske 2Fe-2S domain-containing protein [Dehalococcoidia bacterium]